MEQILQIINERNEVNTLDLAKELNCDHQKIIGAMKSIESFGDVITTTQVSQKTFELTKEGEEIIANGSHEAIVFNNIPETGIEQKELLANVGNAQIGKLGFSKAMSLGWIFLDKSGDKPIVKRKTTTIDDEVQQVLQKIKDLNFNEVAENRKQELKKRKLIQEILMKSFNITKGSNFRLNLEKLETDLTSEMIVKGTWKTKQFKDYNFNAMGIPLERGHLHPLLKVREEFRKIFFELGFTEMPTNNYVEASFWNFDAIFQPQQHPARGEEDTFFISDPANTEDLPMDFVERVRKVHTVGDYGSIGYRSEWRLDEAKKNILRTHTTAVSARLLYQVAQKIRNSPAEKFEPIKWFSIDRVFRNENLDATHLAEFHQIEGVIANVNISLGDIMGILTEFYKKLGMTKLKFKPAYNPYTEPSMEVFSYHDGLKKWVEIGNSGLFRPEMLLTMGLPENVSVIGYGLSLERPTMIKYGLDDIRDLVGHKVDLSMVYENPICILGEN